MQRDNWIVTKSAARPAGKPDRCFYCGRLIGEEHKEECVIRCKTVVVDFTFRTVLAVPEHGDDERIRFHYNDGTWCADNILGDLQERAAERCCCNICEAKVVGDASKEDEDRYGMCFIENEDS